MGATKSCKAEARCCRRWCDDVRCRFFIFMLPSLFLFLLSMLGATLKVLICVLHELARITDWLGEVVDRITRPHVAPTVSRTRSRATCSTAITTTTGVIIVLYSNRCPRLEVSSNSAASCVFASLAQPQPRATWARRINCPWHFHKDGTLRQLHHKCHDLKCGNP